MYVPPFEEEPMREFDRRPWGSYTVLEEAPTFKVKRIEVLPGKRLSYQKHSRRAEHWFVVQGTAKVTLDDHEVTVRTGESIDIAVGTAHRVENPGDEDLIFIEVQRGNYLGEDDIERLQDDYGRTS
jgi:mannose-6-phosphate isomerase